MGIKLILILTLLMGCENFNSEQEKESPLSIYMELPTENGYYIYDYPIGSPSSYTQVKYNTDELTRVFWTSTDSFTYIYQGITITEPIINYSTYSNDDGDGQQLVYIYQDHIRDTLDIIGCVDENCEMIEFIVN